MTAYAHVRDEEGRRQAVRNACLQERTIQSSIGDITVKAPHVRDRSESGIRFTSRILAPYLRRTESVEKLRWLYLKGLFIEDFS